MIILKNEVLTVSVDEKGAQLCSVKGADGTEYIWQADPAVWGRHAPLLFPVIGRLKDSQYTLEGKTYTIGSHGFARDAMFTVAEQSETAVSLRITDTPATLEKWPFRFALTVTFTLEGNTLRKTCKVDNRDDRTMYYELGSHDGFNAPNCPGEKMSDWAIRIPGMDVLEPYGMDESFMMTPKGERRIDLTEGRIPLKPMTYGLDTIVLSDLPTRSAQLVVDDIQILKLTSHGKDIYYTLDGTEPTDQSEKYKKPIELEEGSTVVKAITVNSDGIPSLTVTKTYTIKFPIADAPSVTPTTGQYDEGQKITVNVPDGYKAYYTLDGSIPKPGVSGSVLYSGPIDMPEGNTVFTVVLADSKNRLSEATKRNYELIISE